MHNLKLKHNPLFLFPFSNTRHVFFKLSNQTSQCTSSLLTSPPLQPLLDFSPSRYHQQISLWHVKSCNPTSNGGFILQIYGFRSRCELSWCWVRTFPIFCVWRNHRKTPAGHLYAFTRRRFCHQSRRERWQRLVRHTEDTCSPEWRHRLLLSQTASQCSPLKCSTKKGHAMTYLLSKHTSTNTD